MVREVITQVQHKFQRGKGSYHTTFSHFLKHFFREESGSELAVFTEASLCESTLFIKQDILVQRGKCYSKLMIFSMFQYTYAMAELSSKNPVGPNSQSSPKIHRG